MLLKEKVNEKVGRVTANAAKAVFNSRQVHREWQQWLGLAFQHSQVHDALLYLLINGIKDVRFVDQSIIYGKDLIKHCVQQRPVIDSSIEMTKECLIREQRVIDETVQLLKWHVLHPEVYEISKNYMQHICLNTEIYDVMKWQLACGCNEAIRGLDDLTTARDAAQLAGFRVLCDERVAVAGKEAFLVKPMMSMLSLGMFDYGEESAKLQTNVQKTQ